MPHNRRIWETSPNSGVTSYAYNLAGLLTALTDPDNNTTTYAYNAATELVGTTNPMGYTTTYSYNSAGEMTGSTDADGHNITYGYDKAGRLTAETWVGGNYTASFSYTALGEVKTASDPFSSYSFGYDGFGDLTSQSNAGTPGAPTVTLSYTYDGFFNRSGMSDNLGGSISYSHDLDNRLTGLGMSLTGMLDAQLTFGYDAASLLTGITRTSMGGDTITSSLSYDNADRLTNITHQDTTKSVTLESYTYGYDAASELTSYQDANSSLTYSYDKVGELTGASGTLAGSSYSVSYSYDLNGNRNMTGYQTGTGNELLSDGVYSYTYDDEGNTTSQTDIATGSVTYYSYNYENELVGETAENSQGQVQSQETFTYDVFRNQIGQDLNGTQQWTVFDGSNPYMQFNGSGQLQERYLTNPDGLNEFYGQVSASGTTEWYLTDNLGSVRQVVSTGGSVLDALTYEPYGNLFTQMNSTYQPRFGYAGGSLDPLTGDYQFGARYYSPEDGRWESQDPLGFAAGNTDLYSYVFNDPTNMVDLTGLLPDLPGRSANKIQDPVRGKTYVIPSTPSNGFLPLWTGPNGEAVGLYGGIDGDIYGRNNSITCGIAFKLPTPVGKNAVRLIVAGFRSIGNQLRLHIGSQGVPPKAIKPNPVQFQFFPAFFPAQILLWKKPRFKGKQPDPAAPPENILGPPEPLLPGETPPEMKRPIKILPPPPRWQLPRK
jgi:RHS repeat-associated protein